MSCDFFFGGVSIVSVVSVVFELWDLLIGFNVLFWNC